MTPRKTNINRRAPTKHAATLHLTHLSEANENRLMAVLSYAWVLCVIPLIFKKENAYIQFHARQGVVVACAWLVLWFLGWLPLLNIVIAFPGMVLLLAVNLLAMIRAWHGERWKIPYLYDYVIALDLE